uniref:Uncharacterized protein n=1 Tax=Setaria viridis TaxID=4556 RepID=A0A4U6VQZ3_SETVI|nr:hypothetical protein SEVIR_2G154550v2 [Setaria viridis]
MDVSWSAGISREAFSGLFFGWYSVDPLVKLPDFRMLYKMLGAFC